MQQRGGMTNYIDFDGGNLIILNCAFQKNTAAKIGGALYFSGTGRPTWKKPESKFSGNMAIEDSATNTFYPSDYIITYTEQ